MIGGSVALLAGSGGRLTYKPSKCEHFGNFNCEIQVDQITGGPAPTFNGRVLIRNENEIHCYGLRVQLDATINLKFDTKTDNRVSSHRKLESVLQDASELGAGHYIESPVQEQITEVEVIEYSTDSNESKCIPVTHLEPGSYSAQFNLKWPEESLPASFSTQFGHLHYKIVAYMKSKYCFVQIAEKVLKFKGYNNLSDIPNNLEPLRHEAGFQKSIFSSKKIIQANITIERTGFISTEELPFVINIINQKSFTIRNITVLLARRTIYNINGAKKSILITLDTFENNDISKDEEIICNGQLKVPKNCIPSYKGKESYSVVHLVQYLIKMAEYPGPIKGEVEVIIGTIKEPLDPSGMASSKSMLSLAEKYPQHSSHRERSGSVVSRLSDTSVISTLSLPPTYSQLGSRATSMLSLISLETLPPHYEDLRGN